MYIKWENNGGGGVKSVNFFTFSSSPMIRIFDFPIDMFGIGMSATDTVTDRIAAIVTTTAMPAMPVSDLRNERMIWCASSKASTNNDKLS